MEQLENFEKQPINEKCKGYLLYTINSYSYYIDYPYQSNINVEYWKEKCIERVRRILPYKKYIKICEIYKTKQVCVFIVGKENKDYFYD